MDNLKGLLGIRRMNEIRNARIRELCGVMKGVDERVDGVLRWFGHVERMENDMIMKGECVGSRSVGKPRKRGLDVRQARGMMQDRKPAGANLSVAESTT